MDPLEITVDDEPVRGSVMVEDRYLDWGRNVAFEVVGRVGTAYAVVIHAPR